MTTLSLRTYDDFNLSELLHWRPALTIKRREKPNLPRTSQVQKIAIQLPPDDPVDLWDFTRLIAKSICPSLRETEDYAWLQKKLVKHPSLELELESDMTAEDRTALLQILPGLPPRAGMSAKERSTFMEAYLNHPSRLPWRPVFVSEETIAANSLRMLEIQEQHRRELQQEITNGRIIAFDHNHINSDFAGKNIFIRREDALSYLKAHRLRTTEDAGSFVIPPPPRRQPKASTAKPPVTAKTPSSSDQGEMPEIAVTNASDNASSSVSPSIAPIERSAATQSLPANDQPSPKENKNRQSPKKHTDEPEQQSAATVILRQPRSKREPRCHARPSTIDSTHTPLATIPPFPNR